MTSPHRGPPSVATAVGIDGFRIMVQDVEPQERNGILVCNRGQAPEPGPQLACSMQALAESSSPEVFASPKVWNSCPKDLGSLVPRPMVFETDS